MAEQKTGVTFENAIAFANAMSSMPTKEILQELVLQTSRKVLQRLGKQPAPTGATAGTSGKYSTGNERTLQRSFYVRRVGSFYVRKDGSQRPSKKRSQGLTDPTKWNFDSKGMNVDVTTRITYAGYVRGGTNDEIAQTTNMAKRGWETTDTVAEQMELEAGKIMQKVIAAKYSQWLTANGITNTVS